MNKFKLGDKVWARGDNAEVNLVGVFPGVILGVPMCQLLSHFFTKHSCGGICTLYYVSLEGRTPPIGQDFVQVECGMWPRDEDGRQASSWDVGVWRPNKDVVIFTTPISKTITLPMKKENA